MRVPFFQEEAYAFAPDQRAVLLGGPARPDQSLGRQVIFFFVAVFLCITCNLINALVSVNAPAVMGALGLDSVEVAWLPVVFSMTFVSMNFMLVRFRQEFGLRLYAMIGLGSCCLVIGLHELVRGFAGALMVHAAAGVAAAPLSSLAVYYMMTAMPKPLAISGVVLALGLEQVPTPLARLISTNLTDYDQWRSLYLFGFGMSAICFGCCGLFRLPPSQKSHVFQSLDAISFLLIATGAALVCAVVGMGKAVWWTDRDWLGWALAAAVPLLGLGFAIESRRANPLLDLKWLSGHDLLRFSIVAVVSRLVLSEQSSATGLLSLLGVGNDELRAFSLILVLATIGGAVTAALIFRPDRITELAALVLGPRRRRRLFRHPLHQPDTRPAILLDPRDHRLRERCLYGTGASFWCWTGRPVRRRAFGELPRAFHRVAKSRRAGRLRGPWNISKSCGRRPIQRC